MLLSKLFKKKDNTPHCAVVIVAAGSSLRMGGDKLMMELCHVPVLARTLLAFQQSPLVDEIIVVTRMEKIMDVADICKKYGVTKAKKVIRGGTSRMESALAGVSELSCGTKLIAMQDRSFISIARGIPVSFIVVIAFSSYYSIWSPVRRPD